MLDPTIDWEMYQCEILHVSVKFVWGLSYPQNNNYIDKNSYPFQHGGGV